MGLPMPDFDHLRAAHGQAHAALTRVADQPSLSAIPTAAAAMLELSEIVGHLIDHNEAQEPYRDE